MAAWFLTPGISMDAIVELYTEKPRAAAVVGAALLDTILTETLLSHLRLGRTREELFDAKKGRIGSYDTKARLAYVMGLISSEALNDIAKIGDIRNSFAHRWDITSFEHPEIKKLCCELRLVETTVGPIVPSLTPGISMRFLESDLEEKLANPQSRYILSVKIITNGLVARAEALPKPTLHTELI